MNKYKLTWNSLKIVVVYFIIGILWIIFSDLLLGYLVPNVKKVLQFEIYKGLFYVISTTVLLYFLIRVQFNQIEKKNTILEKSKEYNRLLFNTSPIGLALCNMDGSLVDINLAYAEIIGRTIDETLKLTYWDITPEKYAAQEALQLKSLDSTGHYGPYEKEYIHIDGHHVPVVLYGRIIVKDNEKYIWSTVEDITDRKLAEKELKESHRMLDSTLENMTDGFVSLDKNWIYTYVNKNAAKIFNKDKPEDLIGKHIWTEYPEGIGQPFYKAYYKAIETGEPIVIEEYYEPWNRWFENRIIPSEQGLSIFFQDITERKFADKALEESNYRNKILFDYAPIPIWEEDFSEVKSELDKLKNKNSKDFNKYFDDNPEELKRFANLIKIIAVNEKSKEFYDVDTLTQLNTQLSDWFVEESWQVFKEELVALANNLTKFEAEIKVRTPTGEVKFLHLLLNIPPDSSERLDRVFVSFNDITERKEAEIELQAHQENLEKLVDKRTNELQEQSSELKESQDALLFLLEDINESRDELEKVNEKLVETNSELEAFTYSVSHDLKSPLRAIDGFSKYLLEDYSNKLDNEGKRLLNIIRENTKKMDHLILDLLRLSKISRSEMYVSKIDMTNLVHSVYKELSNPEINDKYKFTINELPQINADKVLLKQVWLNLISNAIKFTSKSKVRNIEIGCIIENDNYNFYIKDSGTGFDPKYESKLFGLFQRLHKSEDFEGTGVGLAIVKRIIFRHGGKVWAQSKLGKGATFYFSLPV